jgi:hypothetical protein
MSIQRFNVPRIVVQSAFGQHHTRKHRLAAGLIIMAFGVMIAKTGGDVHVYGLHYVFDGLGYLVHAIGGIPFLELFESEE